MKSLLLLLAIFVVFFLLRRMSFSYRQKLLIGQKNLLDCQLKLDKIAYKMEEKLLKEEFRLGTPCHDIWFPIVNRTRYANKYFSTSSLLCFLIPAYRRRAFKEIEEMDKEVKKMHPSMKRLYDEYQDVLFEAFQIRHNVIFRILVVIFLLKSLPQIFKAVKSSQAIKPNVDWPQEILSFQLSA